ncbi:ubinuclein-1-like isoform X2 [Anneissia japonica]|uniref:ubinuclein-1-like isoform X2 n=1 Tax=Anneissia japonica TaxID=1529436 RepID=UPI0014258DB9|nr:ubinuclein-1-like isoform X2 [Anneissia japonica]
MAERRRIIPSSVGPFIKQEEAKPKKPTLRFTLSLAESNERECSEFSFSQLMKNALGDEVEQPEPKFNELEEDDLTGMAALARKFEQKYGPQKAKKKRQQIEDIIDVGLGYDETDPFVDNSECYDELIPSMLDTQHGGFYINSGQLDFKEIDASSDDSEIHVHKKRKNNKSGKKKRSKSSESRNGSKKERKKRKSSSMADTSKKKAKRHLSGHLGREKKKKKDKSNPLTVAELLQRKAEVNSGFSSKATAKTPVAPTLNNGSITTLEEEAADLMGSFNLPLDSEMEQAMRDVMVMDVENTMGMASDAEMSASANEGDSTSVGYTKCPEGLKEPLKLNIMKIKEAARKSEEGKCKFFTSEVNDLLLDIETQLRALSCGTRSTVYSHLSHHLPCGKETLLKRAKKLRLSQQDSKLKAPLQKLREAVGQAMPTLLERYQEECQAATQAKYDKIINGKEKPEEIKSEEDDDGGGDKNKTGIKSSLPRKKFIWTDTLRDLLCKVVIVKVRAYEMLKSRSQSAEDYLKAFLEAEIKGFWPQGWMQTRMLFKESRSVHQHLTSSNPVKPKKPFVLLHKVQLAKKSPSPVPPETPSSAPNPAPSEAVAGLSYASSILKEMAHTKKADNAQKDVPTILDYANKNNAATNYSVIYSSTAKAAGNTSAANLPLRLSGNVGKTSPVMGTQSSNQHSVEHLHAKDTNSHQPQLNAIKTANNKNFNDSFVHSLIAKNLKMAADSVGSQEGFSDLKPPDMSSAFELLAEAAMEHSDASGKSTNLKSLGDSRQQHSVGISGLNQLKTLNKDKNTQPVVRMNLLDKKLLKSVNMDLANQTKHMSLHSSQGTQQKSYANSSSTASTPLTMPKGTNNVTPKWSGNSYLKMVDKTKQLPTHATQFATNTQHKNMFHTTIHDGHTVSKDKDSLISSKLPSKDVNTSPGVMSNTNKQFLTPQHVSPKRTVQTSGYMQQQRGSNASVIPQRLSSSAPKQPLSQHVKQTNRTSPSPFNSQSPTGPSSMAASGHSPMSPRTSPSSPSTMSARSLFHHPTSPQQQQPTTVGAVPQMNLLGLNYANNYTMQQFSGFQMQFADMAMKHSGNFAMSVGQGSPGHSLQQQSSANQTSPEAVITGPAPGTFYYTQGGSNPRFSQDSSGQMQHRIP